MQTSFVPIQGRDPEAMSYKDGAVLSIGHLDERTQKWNDALLALTWEDVNGGIHLDTMDNRIPEWRADAYVTFTLEGEESGPMSVGISMSEYGYAYASVDERSGLTRAPEIIAELVRQLNARGAPAEQLAEDTLAIYLPSAAEREMTIGTRALGCFRYTTKMQLLHHTSP